MRAAALFALSLAALPLLAAACGDDDPAAGADSAADATAGDTGGPAGDAPEHHRSTAATCDDIRGSADPVIPDGGFAPDPQCRAHTDCAAGVNGRCVGNTHDGWYCTYDECFADAGCGATAVCACGGGFRSDHNICLGEGNCRTDADCGAGGYCSPTLGSCGSFTGTVGYYCHTAADECTNDADCGATGEVSWGPYCAYNAAAGRWMCQDTHCAG